MNPDDPTPGNGTPQSVPIKLNMGIGPGFVQLEFDPPAVRMRFDAKSARALAIAILQNAEACEAPPPPPPSLIQQLEKGPIIPLR